MDCIKPLISDLKMQSFYLLHTAGHKKTIVLIFGKMTSEGMDINMRLKYCIP